MRKPTPKCKPKNRLILLSPLYGRRFQLSHDLMEVSIQALKVKVPTISLPFDFRITQLLSCCPDGDGFATSTTPTSCSDHVVAHFVQASMLTPDPRQTQLSMGAAQVASVVRESHATLYLNGLTYSGRHSGMERIPKRLLGHHPGTMKYARDGS